MSAQIRYQRKDVLSTAVEDDLVLFDEQAGKYYTISKVGTTVWRHLRDPLTLDELCKRLTDEYDIDSTTCAAQIKDFLDSLEARSLINKIL